MYVAVITQCWYYDDAQQHMAPSRCEENHQDVISSRKLCQLYRPETQHVPVLVRKNRINVINNR